MNSSPSEKGSLKRKVLHELSEYWIIVFYLALAFAAFLQYRRLVLGAQHISYTHYFVALVKAMVLAKVILIGEMIRLGRGLEDRPLIIPTLSKTVLFVLFLSAFELLEEGIKGLWRGKGLTGGIADFLGEGTQELLSRGLVVFAALIPFFAFRELGRVMGQEKIRALFFKSRDQAPRS